MRLSILIFDGLTTLDAIGGYEVLARLPGMETEFVAARRGIVAADTRQLGLAAFREFSEVMSTDILYVPGGPGGFMPTMPGKRILRRPPDHACLAPDSRGCPLPVSLPRLSGAPQGRFVLCW